MINYFNVPADFRQSTIDKYVQLNQAFADSRVFETYGSITVNKTMKSGRSIEGLPKVDLYELKEYVRYSRDRGIRFNYTLNASFMNNDEFTTEGLSEIFHFLECLYEIGICSLTIAMPSLIDIVCRSPYPFHIKASTICQITNANKAVEFKRMGVERIVVDESINRNFTKLRQISNSFGDSVDVIINSICFLDCVYRMFHYNQISVDSVSATNPASAHYFSNRCLLRRFRDVGSILKQSWIRPEDLPYYNMAGIHNFKIQGRHLIQSGDPVRMLEHYFERKYEGNLMDLLDCFSPINSFKINLNNQKLQDFLVPIISGKIVCSNDCDNCNYCTKYAEKIIDAQEIAEMRTLCTQYIEASDDFNAQVDATSSMIYHIK